MRGPTLFLIGIFSLTSIPAEAEVCLTNVQSRAYSPTPNCVSLIVLGRMAKEHGFGEIEDFNQYVELSTDENDRPLALVWHNAYLSSGIGPDLKTAIETDQLRAKLALDLRASACIYYRDFISVGGVVQFKVRAHLNRKVPVDPQNDAPATIENVAQIRVDHC